MLTYLGPPALNIVVGLGGKVLGDPDMLGIFVIERILVNLKW